MTRRDYDPGQCLRCYVELLRAAKWPSDPKQAKILMYQIKVAAEAQAKELYRIACERKNGRAAAEEDSMSRTIEQLPPLTATELKVLGPRGPYRGPDQPPRVILSEDEVEMERIRDTAEKRRGPAHTCGDYPSDPCGGCLR
jgi:hypothetical protein